MNSLKPFGKSSYVSQEEALEELEKYNPSERVDGDDSQTNREDSGDNIEGPIHAALANPKDYIQVPGVTGLYGNPVVISRFEVQGLNNMNYNNTHKAVLQKRNGLYIPTPRIFMPHFRNVVTAYKNNQQLLDAEGNPIRREEHGEIYRHLTTNFKDAYGGTNLGAWTWLNARFVQGTGFNNLDLETIIGIKPDGTFETRKDPLESCLDRDGVFVDLAFNSQGFPTQESAEQNYEQGQNIGYWKPVEGRVAGFWAGSNRAVFSCGWGPGSSDSSLGVFLCAEGAR